MNPACGGSSGSASFCSNSRYEAFGMRKCCKGHGVLASVYTSYSEDNTGRFMRCSMRGTDDCKYFEWIDDELPPEFKIVVARVARKKNILEAQLRESRQKVAVLAEQLTLMERKVKIIEQRNKELQVTNTHFMKKSKGDTMELSSWSMNHKVCYLLLFILVLVLSSFTFSSSEKGLATMLL
ncbi:hypothetical protein ACS0TY_003372 [Phlomoides rotata]